MSPDLRLPLLFATSLLAAGCGDGSQPAGPDAAVIDATGSYERVMPGYDTEAACRAANSDALVNCVEQILLCANGRVAWLFTDIVFDGTWAARGDEIDVVMSSFEDGDGSFVFERRADSSLFSAEVYGDRAFTVATGDGLCP